MRWVSNSECKYNCDKETCGRGHQNPIGDLEMRLSPEPTAGCSKPTGLHGLGQFIGEFEGLDEEWAQQGRKMSES
jgi:hypothetical protein